MKYLDSASPRRSIVRASIFVALVFAGVALIGHIELPGDLRRLAGEGARDPLILTVILSLYVALLALPFVPGAELGFLLLGVLGADVAVPVYLATVAALTLSFAIGRFAPHSIRAAIPARLGITRKGATEPSTHIGSFDATLQHETPSGISNRWIRSFLKYRQLALIVLINTPGNSVLGGGGGIAMAAGISRLFTFRAFMFSVAVAVAPVPMTVIIVGRFDWAALGHSLQAVSVFF
jgi:hypothetical protein